MTDIRNEIMDKEMLFLHCWCGMESMYFVHDPEIDMWDVGVEFTYTPNIWERAKLAYKYIFKGERFYLMQIDRHQIEKFREAMDIELKIQPLEKKDGEG